MPPLPQNINGLSGTGPKTACTSHPVWSVITVFASPPAAPAQFTVGPKTALVVHQFMLTFGTEPCRGPD